MKKIIHDIVDDSFLVMRGNNNQKARFRFMVLISLFPALESEKAQEKLIGH
jgi:hypothetical protein